MLVGNYGGDTEPKAETSVTWSSVRLRGYLLEGQGVVWYRISWS